MTRVCGLMCPQPHWHMRRLIIMISALSLFDCGYIKPIKTGTIIERLIDTRDKVEAVIEQYQPDEIAIEDIVQFMPRGTSAQNSYNIMHHSIVWLDFVRMIILVKRQR